MAGPPFEATDMTDVILQTSDGVQFHINKIILSLSSQFFKDMFTLPPPPKESNSADAEQKLPVIHVDDDTQGLFQLLSWCHPHGAPSTDFDNLVVTLRLANKYDMEHTIKRVEKFLRSSTEVVKKDCFRVYAIAMQYQLWEVAKMAAQYTLEIPINDIPDAEEFKLISGADLQKLNRYRSDCVVAMRKVVGNHEWSQTGIMNAWPEVKQIASTGCQCLKVDTYKQTHMRLWLIRYMDILESKCRDTPASDGSLDGNSFDLIRKSATCSSCSAMLNGWVTYNQFVASITKRLSEAKSMVSLALIIYIHC